MSGVNFLTDADVALLKRMARDYQNKIQNLGKLYEAEAPKLKRDSYIVLVPSTGITGVLKGNDDEYGGTGTGTGTGAGRDIINFIQCEVYQVLSDEWNAAFLESAGFSIEVYNASSMTVEEGYALAVKDKYGRWVFASTEATSQTGALVRFTIDSVVDDLATVTVDAVAFGLDDTIASVNSQIEVVDALGCLFADEADADLVGRQGYAAYMTPGGPGTSTGSVEAPRWEVVSLCCPPGTTGTAV